MNMIHTHLKKKIITSIILLTEKITFNDLFKKLMDVKKSIYIIGFIINPEVFLSRPVDEKYI